MRTITISAETALSLVGSFAEQHKEEAKRVSEAVTQQRALNEDENNPAKSSQVRINLQDAEVLSDFIATAGLLSKKQLQLG